MHEIKYRESRHFRRTGTALEGQESDSPFSRNVSLYVLKSFYQTPYDLEKDFYPQFYERLGEAKKIFG